MARFRRGDRVMHVLWGQAAIVEGWKGTQVLVCWGLQQAQQGYIRSWVPADDLVHLDAAHLLRGPPN